MSRLTRIAPIAIICVSLSGASLSAIAAEPTSARGGAATASASTASKAPIAPWRVLSGAQTITHEADLLRVGSRVHVVWSQSDTSAQSVRTRILSSTAKPIGGIHTVVSNWVSLISSPQLVAHDGRIVAVFAGIHTAGASPFTGPAVHASSTDGQIWALEGGAMSQTTAAGNETTGIAVAEAAGEPLFAMGDFGTHVTMHRGIDSDPGPSDQPDFTSSDSNCCPATFVSLASDRVTGQTWAAWHNLGASQPSHDGGMYAQKIWPRPNGTLLRAPFSRSTTGQAINPGQAVALAARAGGGVYAAYAQGYPTSKTIRIWKVGTGSSWTVRSRLTVDLIALAAAPGGRLWLSWRTVGDGLLHAARTNTKVTRLGVLKTLPTPGRGGGQYWNTSVEGSAGPLTIVANADAGTGPHFYAAQVRPGLVIRATPRVLNRGRVLVRVTEAGEGVRGATVRFHGKVKRTNALGRVIFRVGARVPEGSYRATARKVGYTSTATVVRVR